MTIRDRAKDKMNSKYEVILNKQSGSLGVTHGNLEGT